VERNKSACLGASPSVIGHSREKKSCNYSNSPETITRPGGPPRSKNTSHLGAVFEVRQGYKSMDSKRQAADIANAAQALTKSRMPVLVVMSQQIDPVLVTRYNASGWGLLRGLLDEPDPLISTFAFFDQVLGYNLVAFFERNHDSIRTEVDGILRSILEVR